MEFTVPPEFAGRRIDSVLPELAAKLSPGLSRAAIQKVIAEGGLRINGTVCTEKKRAAESGDFLQLEEPRNTAPEWLDAENIPLDILYEDDAMLVISKPAGMVVHPGAGNHSGTVANAVLGHDLSLADEFASADPARPGIVHRLDKDTSGCLILAKTVRSMTALCASFASHTVHKTYLALVSPAPRVQTMEIKNFIGRHPVNRKKMAVVRDENHGKFAHTLFTVEETGKIGGLSAALVKVRIMTGRTHQIRVHMSSVGSPVLGDRLYGGKSGDFCERQMLHAWKISFPHPETGKLLSMEAPLPEDFSTLLNQLRKG